MQKKMVLLYRAKHYSSEGATHPKYVLKIEPKQALNKADKLRACIHGCLERSWPGDTFEEANRHMTVVQMPSRFSCGSTPLSASNREEHDNLIWYSPSGKVPLRIFLAETRLAQKCFVGERNIAKLSWRQQNLRMKS